MSEAKTAVAAAAGKYLTFALAQEEYGLLVIKVREIIKIMDITAVPQVPEHVKGVINLRGKVIPIIDLRLKFGLADQAYTERTCIIVAEVQIDGRALMLGVIVDSVSEVLNIAPDEIEPAPDFGERLDTAYMQGIAKIKGKVKILLDLDRVLSADGVFAKAAYAGIVLALEQDAALTDRDLGQIVRLVYDRSGITLHEGKRSLVTARLQKRLRAHGYRTFSQYLQHVESDTSGDELTELLDAIATNHTYFFREEQHFEMLGSRVVPEWRERRETGLFKVWSAACSTGEEPYTIAMTLRDMPAAPEFSIAASDLSTKALRAAKAAVYKMQTVQSLPREVLRKHFERGMGEQAGLARVAREVRAKVTFRNLNLLEITDLGERFDVVFCRNVMIYFDKAVQQRVVQMLERHVKPGGYLFISHAESLNGVSHRLRWMAPAVYRRDVA